MIYNMQDRLNELNLYRFAILKGLKYWNILVGIRSIKQRNVYNY